MKTRYFKEIINRFYPQGKIKIYLLIFFSIIAGLFEFIGLIFIFQFTLFLFNPNSLYCAKAIKIFNSYFNIYDLPQISITLGCLICLTYILKNVYMLFFTKISSNILKEMSLETYKKIFSTFLFQDYLKISSFSISNKYTIFSKIEITLWQYCSRIINLYTNIIIGIVILCYLFYKFTFLACFIFLFMGILATIQFYFLKKRSNYQKKHYSNAVEKNNNFLIKTINLLKEIKIQNCENYFLDNFMDSLKNLCELNNQKNINNVLHIYWTEISIMFTFAFALLILFFTSNFDNQIVISSTATICVIILRITPIVNRIQSSLFLINSTEKVAVELLEFDENYGNYIKRKDNQKINFNSSIKFENVSFSYPNSKDGLKNINFEIKKDDFIGIVGKSGCYKSTLSLLLLGLIEPDKGRILIDGVELSEENKKAWHSKISLITQEYNLLFDKTVDNFEPFNEFEIKKILKELDIEDVLNNENISNISQGQKQRLAFACALYKNNDILILDEITSSIDVISEDKVNLLLEKLKAKKTIISIAHRLQILKHCTKILYIDDGSIIDFDTFENLNKKYEEFKKIIELSSFKIKG